MNQDISNNDYTIDVRDIIARVEELENEQHDSEACPDCEVCPTCEGIEKADDCTDHKAVDCGKRDELEAEELAALTELLSDLRGYGGDEQWKGDWYPLTLVRDSL